ncbi:MAG TPA: hypothetical protein VIC28_14675, partial [Thermoanaerobaculia bacterium]
MKVPDLEQRRIEGLCSARLEIPVPRLESFLPGLTGEQKRLLVTRAAPGKIEEPIKDVCSSPMVTRGPAHYEIEPELPLRCLDFAALLVNARRVGPDTGKDLARLRQPVHPNEDLGLLSKVEVGPDGRRPRARISLRHVNGLASPRGRLVLFRFDEVEAALHLALPAAGQRAEESQGTERAEVDAGHRADYRANSTAIRHL